MSTEVVLAEWSSPDNGERIYGLSPQCPRCGELLWTVPTDERGDEYYRRIATSDGETTQVYHTCYECGYQWWQNEKTDL